MTTTESELQVFIKLPKHLKQVAVCLALGCTNQEIGFSVGLSNETVRAYKNRLYEAVGIHGSLKLAVFIVRHPQIEKMLRESL
jgi:DNA-binding NarL/FixJ family response regulator